MREIHKDICGNYSRARSLVHKLIRAKDYWPTMLKDAQAYVKACDKCQRFSNLIRPFEELTPMTPLWPFAQWGLDIMGSFQTGVRQLKFLVVGIDYFTKWVEAKALATITKRNIRSFFWRNIICRFEIPRVLVSDNRKQFDNSAFRDFYSELGIKNHYSTLAHPSQWAGRSHEQILAQDKQDLARGDKRYLAGRATKHLVGIPNYSKNTHWRNTVLTSIRE